MSESQLAERDVLRGLQQIYEARGLKFHIHPPREMVPEFLGNFQPDAIAQGQEGGIIIEVKLRRDPRSDKQLAAIAQKVSGQKGWEFRAIYVDPLTDDAPPIAKPTPEQLHAAFSEIDALNKGGHPTAALIVAWAALESLARLATARTEVGKRKSFSPIQSIQALAEEGYIEGKAADQLRELAKVRNAVVHGDFSITVSEEQVQTFLSQIKAISSDVFSVATGVGD